MQIVPLAIPTPFYVGDVNVYLIKQDPITLIDVGPKTKEASDTLRRKLADNGVKISELDFERLAHPRYDKKQMLEKLGRSGPIAFEVHENDPGMGEKRWGKGAKTRWRNVRIREYPSREEVATRSATQEAL